MYSKPQRCHALGIHLYNFHPGSRPKGGDLHAALNNVASAINEVHLKVPEVVMVIETMAGQGGQVLNEIVNACAMTPYPANMTAGRRNLRGDC